MPYYADEPEPPDADDLAEWRRLALYYYAEANRLQATGCEWDYRRGYELRERAYELEEAADSWDGGPGETEEN